MVAQYMDLRSMYAALSSWSIFHIGDDISLIFTCHSVGSPMLIGVSLRSSNVDSEIEIIGTPLMLPVFLRTIPYSLVWMPFFLRIGDRCSFPSATLNSAAHTKLRVRVLGQVVCRTSTDNTPIRTC